jgi:hypothetical protein
MAERDALVEMPTRRRSPPSGPRRGDPLTPRKPVPRFTQEASDCFVRTLRRRRGAIPPSGGRAFSSPRPASSPPTPMTPRGRPARGFRPAARGDRHVAANEEREPTENLLLRKLRRARGEVDGCAARGVRRTPCRDRRPRVPSPPRPPTPAFNYWARTTDPTLVEPVLTKAAKTLFKLAIEGG